MAHFVVDTTRKASDQIGTCFVGKAWVKPAARQNPILHVVPSWYRHRPVPIGGAVSVSSLKQDGMPSASLYIGFIQ